MGRQEILSGVERRRRWTEEDKVRLLSEAAALGYGGVATVARRHDLHPNQLYTWKRDLADRHEACASLFLPVMLDAPERAPGSARPAPLRTLPEGPGTIMIEVRLGNGRALRLPADFPDDRLAGLIRLVERA